MCAYKQAAPNNEVYLYSNTEHSWPQLSDMRLSMSVYVSKTTCINVCLPISEYALYVISV